MVKPSRKLSIFVIVFLFFFRIPGSLLLANKLSPSSSQDELESSSQLHHSVFGSKLSSTEANPAFSTSNKAIDSPKPAPSCSARKLEGSSAADRLIGRSFCGGSYLAASSADVRSNDSGNGVICCGKWFGCSPVTASISVTFMRDKSSCCRPLESLVEEAKCFIRFLRSLSLKFMWDKARSALIVFYPVYRQSFLFSAPKFTFDRQASFTVYRQGFLFSAPKFTFDRQASFTGRRGSCFNLREMSTSSFHTIANAKQQQEIKLLEGINDNYGGVVIKMNEPMDPNNFASMLKSSMSCWKNQGKKGVWIELPIHLANLVEPAVKEGFWFHHAEQSYLMLANWIPGGAHTLPANASHRVGVGAFVFNEEKRELLVVQENSGRYRGKGIWKIPTGVVEQGEDICDAAEREVKEETSIEAKFVEVLAFRQSHKSFFGKSDLFFLCFMRPQTFDVKYQETELEAAKWMALEEYLKLPHVQDQEFTKYIIDLGLAKLEGSYNGFSPVPTISLFSDQKFNLYLNTVDLKHPKPASTG